MGQSRVQMKQLTKKMIKNIINNFDLIFAH